MDYRDQNNKLSKIATQLRIDVLDQLVNAGSGHAAGPLSAADIFTFLYFEHLQHRPEDPNWDERDYFLLSNGHICTIWYASLARSGYFPVEELKTFRKFGSRLQGHPWNLKTPGVFNSSGMLGHSAGQAVGVALGLKLDKKNNKVICFLSDGEQQEGANWEALMSAPKFGLDNLTFVVDKNNIQIDGFTKDIMPLEDGKTTLADKYRSFRWDVIEIDGHNLDEIREAFLRPNNIGQPKLILSNSIAGKGVSEIENDPSYHDWRGDSELAKRAIEKLKTEL